MEENEKTALETCREWFANAEKSQRKAKWLYWPGWEGNHDRRIEGAKCSYCGWEHPTVYGSTDKLGKICYSCHSRMSV